MKKYYGSIIALVCFLASVILGTIFTIDVVQAGETIRKGITVDNVDIGGMTEKQANKAIKNRVNEIKKTDVIIKIDGEDTTISLGKLGYKWTNTNVANEALNIGKKGNPIRRYKDQLDIERNGKQYFIEMTVSKKKIVSGLQELCADYNVEAKNASIEMVNGELNIIPEKTGIVVDYDETSEEIYNYITEEWDKASKLEFEAISVVDKPQVTAEDLKDISSTPMGKYTTTFGVGGSFYNRNMNIKNGARLLDGIVLYPDEIYSLNEHLAPWTEENGYYPACTYVDGAVADSLGGGICQVSSTLYNALLLAEIEIVERYPHSMSVAYVPLAADAALAGDYKDLKFKNNTNSLIYIQAIYEEGALTFKVFGKETRPSNRTIEYKSETISTTPIKKEIKKDKTKPTDYEEVVSNGHVGYVAKLWKIVYEDGVEVDKVLVNTSTYRMTPTKIVKGTKKTKKDKDKDKDSDKDEEKETEQKAEEPEDTVDVKPEEPTDNQTEEE